MHIFAQTIETRMLWSRSVTFCFRKRPDAHSKLLNELVHKLANVMNNCNSHNSQYLSIVTSRQNI